MYYTAKQGCAPDPENLLHTMKGGTSILISDAFFKHTYFLNTYKHTRFYRYSYAQSQKAMRVCKCELECKAMRWNSRTLTAQSAL